MAQTRKEKRAEIEKQKLAAKKERIKAHRADVEYWANRLIELRDEKSRTGLSLYGQFRDEFEAARIEKPHLTEDMVTSKVRRIMRKRAKVASTNTVQSTTQKKPLGRPKGTTNKAKKTEKKKKEDAVIRLTASIIMSRISSSKRRRNLAQPGWQSIMVMPSIEWLPKLLKKWRRRETRRC